MLGQQENWRWDSFVLFIILWNVCLRDKIDLSDNALRWRGTYIFFKFTWKLILKFSQLRCYVDNSLMIKVDKIDYFQ